MVIRLPRSPADPRPREKRAAIDIRTTARRALNSSRLPYVRPSRDALNIRIAGESFVEAPSNDEHRGLHGAPTIAGVALRHPARTRPSLALWTPARSVATRSRLSRSVPPAAGVQRRCWAGAGSALPPIGEPAPLHGRQIPTTGPTTLPTPDAANPITPLPPPAKRCACPSAPEPGRQTCPRSPARQHAALALCGHTLCTLARVVVCHAALVTRQQRTRWHAHGASFAPRICRRGRWRESAS